MKGNPIAWENTEKWITFPVPIEKEFTRIGKNGEESTKTISDRFADSERLMASSLSNLVNNLAEVIHKSKCKNGHDKKNMKRVGLNTKIMSVFLNMQTLKIIK